MVLKLHLLKLCNIFLRNRSHRAIELSKLQPVFQRSVFFSCSWRKVREIACEQVAIELAQVLRTSDLPRKWREIFEPITELLNLCFLVLSCFVFSEYVLDCKTTVSPSHCDRMQCSPWGSHGLWDHKWRSE